MVHAGTLSPFPTMGLWSFCGTSRQAQRRKDRGQGHKALGMEEHRQGKQQTVGHGHGHGQKPRPRPADHVDELDLVAGGHDDEVRDAPEVRKVEAAVVRGPAAGGPIPAAALRSPHRTLPIHPHASTHARTHTHRPTSHPTPNPPPQTPNLRTSALHGRRGCFFPGRPPVVLADEAGAVQDEADGQLLQRHVVHHLRSAVGKCRRAAALRHRGKGGAAIRGRGGGRSRSRSRSGEKCLPQRDPRG